MRALSQLATRISIILFGDAMQQHNRTPKHTLNLSRPGRESNLESLALKPMVYAYAWVMTIVLMHKRHDPVVTGYVGIKMIL